MATSEQTKIMHDEYGQDDGMDFEIDEYFDFFNKNQISGSFDEVIKSPEILAFLYSHDILYELYEYVVLNFDRSIKTIEDAVKEGIRLKKEFKKTGWKEVVNKPTRLSNWNPQIFAN